MPESLFVLFIFTIVLSVRLQLTDSDYPHGIFKLFYQRGGLGFNSSILFLSLF